MYVCIHTHRYSAASFYDGIAPKLPPQCGAAYTPPGVGGASADPAAVTALNTRYDKILSDLNTLTQTADKEILKRGGTIPTVGGTWLLDAGTRIALRPPASFTHCHLPSVHPRRALLLCLFVLKSDVYRASPCKYKGRFIHSVEISGRVCATQFAAPFSNGAGFLSCGTVLHATPPSFCSAPTCCRGVLMKWPMY
jgi:hypothetical protein